MDERTCLTAPQKGLRRLAPFEIVEAHLDDAPLAM